MIDQVVPSSPAIWLREFLINFRKENLWFEGNAEQWFRASSKDVVDGRIQIGEAVFPGSGQ